MSLHDPHRQTRPKAIFFDAAGTLFHVRGSVAEIYLSYAEKYGVTRSDDLLAKIRSAFARAFQDAPPPIFAVSDPAEIKRCERLWWFDIVHNVFYRVGMFERFDDYFEEIFQAFDGPSLWSLYPDTVKVLAWLKGEGFELGIISNFDTRLFNVLRGLGLDALFDTVTISSLARAAKPSPQIFHAALDKHVVDPDEAWHIGDSLRDDVGGARGAGLRAVFLSRDHTPAPDSSPDLLTIRTLQDLEPLLRDR